LANGWTVKSFVLTSETGTAKSPVTPGSPIWFKAATTESNVSRPYLIKQIVLTKNTRNLRTRNWCATALTEAF